jgi:uridine kinase
MNRKQLLATIANNIQALPTTTTRRIAIDGVDGAGKTHLANELAEELEARGAPTIRASTDGFHNPPAKRHQQGRNSPVGYYQDSYNYEALTTHLLDPLSPGGDGRYIKEIYDVHQESPITPTIEEAPPAAILIFDGIFTHRPELTKYWDYSIWLEVPFTVSIPRGAQRGYGHPNPTHESNNRYITGQQLYIAECSPAQRATITVNNTDLANPLIQ